MSTVLLIHADGTNGSTTVTEETGKTVTVNGNAQISTAQSKFGGSSLLFDGSGDYLTLAETADFNGFTISDLWTIEFWMRQSTNATGVVLAFGDSSGGVCGQINFEASGGNQNVYLRPQGGTTGYWKQDAYAFDTNWNHYAFTCNGSSLAVYRNGVSVGALSSFSFTTADIPAGVIIGASYNAGVYSSYFNGNVDEIRMLKGEVAYSSGFTPSASPFTIPVISGTVIDDAGAAAARTVRLYRRDTGALVATTTSTGGAFAFSNPENLEYYVVALDDASGTQYNALIYDKITRG